MSPNTYIQILNYDQKDDKEGYIKNANDNFVVNVTFSDETEEKKVLEEESNSICTLTFPLVNLTLNPVTEETEVSEEEKSSSDQSILELDSNSKAMFLLPQELNLYDIEGMYDEFLQTKHIVQVVLLNRKDFGDTVVNKSIIFRKQGKSIEITYLTPYNNNNLAENKQAQEYLKEENEKISEQINQYQSLNGDFRFYFAKKYGE